MVEGLLEAGESTVGSPVHSPGFVFMSSDTTFPQVFRRKLSLSLVAVQRRKESRDQVTDETLWNETFFSFSLLNSTRDIPTAEGLGWNVSKHHKTIISQGRWTISVPFFLSLSTNQVSLVSVVLLSPVKVPESLPGFWFWTSRTLCNKSHFEIVVKLVSSRV